MEYKEALEKAEHLIALKQSVYLYNDGERPWHAITKVEPGSSYRFETPVDLRFTAVEKGITFHWSEDVEVRGSNGAPELQIDMPRIKQIIAKTPDSCRSGIREWARAASDAMSKRAEERKAFMRKMDRMIDDLQLIAELV